MSQPIDLRSDTVTRPTPAMRRAMNEAEVGDDVYGDDPTVIALQEQVAALLGKEAALYVPSGTMSNQTAINAQTCPGDEIICDVGSHIYQYEAGGPAVLSGCSVRVLEGDRGRFTAEQVAECIRPTDSHQPRSRLVVVENTHNRGGGSVWRVEQVASVREAADRYGLLMHLDGARLLNACVATGRRPPEYTQYFESVSICFSKGLGAPVGSAVAGTREFIGRVHRVRKRLGGGMRQAGIIAAGALYALNHHVERLAEDHANAKRLAEALENMDGVELDAATVETNIVRFALSSEKCSAADFCGRLRAVGVWMYPTGPQQVRAVTHLDVSRDQIETAINRIAEVLDRP